LNISAESEVLSSWKDIALYLGKGVRTVQRWERHLGLPVRRPVGASQKSAVLLYRGDVDEWLATRFSTRAFPQAENPQIHESSASARSTLKEGIRAARELRTAHHALTEQISASIQLLTQRCDLLAAQSLRIPGVPVSTTPDLKMIPELLLTALPKSRTPGAERIA
jgi:hypothetical protein